VLHCEGSPHLGTHIRSFIEAAALLCCVPFFLDPANDFETQLANLLEYQWFQIIHLHRYWEYGRLGYLPTWQWYIYREWEERHLAEMDRMTEVLIAMIAAGEEFPILK
jgi:hypothetical protein